jgi:hypothetical protein
MMSGPLLFVGEGFFPNVSSFAYAFPSFASLEGWRDLLAFSTVPFSSLVRCLAGAPLARGPVAPALLLPLLFGVSIHRTPFSTRGAISAPAGFRLQGRGRALAARQRPIREVLRAPECLRRLAGAPLSRAARCQSQELLAAPAGLPLGSAAL